MAVTVVTLDPADWDRYKALRLEALKTDPLAFGSTYEQQSLLTDDVWQARLQKTLTNNDGSLLFAEVDGKLVGMLGWTGKEHTGPATIISMFVSPNFRRRGISRLLVETVLSHIRRFPIKTVILDVRSSQAPALALYQALGFTETHRVEDQSGDGCTYIEITMAKDL